MSQFWSKALRRHLNINFLPSLEFFNQVSQDPEYLYSTLSLRIRNLGAFETRPEILAQMMVLEHPLLLPLDLQLSKPFKIVTVLMIVQSL